MPRPRVSGSPKGLLSKLVMVLCLLVGLSSAATKIRSGADPTIMKVGDMYYSAEAGSSGIYVRRASSILGLGANDVDRKQVWTDSAKLGAIWAPEISRDSGRTYIYVSLFICFGFVAHTDTARVW